MPRIIFVSSESHRNPEKFEWDTFGQFQVHKMAKTVERYGYYKLLMTREAPAIVQPIMKLVFKIFFSSPEKAAEPVVFMAASKDLEGKPKDYLFLMSRKAVDDKAADQENGKKLWSLTEQLLDKTL